jgi:hypothetical protein
LGEWGEGVEWMGEGVRMNGSVEPERIGGSGRERGEAEWMGGSRWEEAEWMGGAGGERVNG